MSAIPPALRAAVCGGVVIAALYWSVFTGSTGGMVLVYLVPLPLFIVGLAFGLAATLAAAALGAMLMVLVTGSIAPPLAFLVTTALPVVPLIRQALLSRRHSDGTLEWYPPGYLLLVLAGLGGTLIIIAGVLGSVIGTGDGLKALVHDLLAQVLAPLLNSDIAPGIRPDDALFETLTQVFPGVAVTSWLILVMANGLLAQTVLARLKGLRRPPLRMSDVDLPHWAPLVLALTMAGAATLNGEAGFLLVNLAIVLALPFLFSGLAVVHAFAATRSSKAAILLVFYVLMALFAWLVPVVIGLGIIDQWAGLRRRFGAGISDRGDV